MGLEACGSLTNNTTLRTRLASLKENKISLSPLNEKVHLARVHAQEKKKSALFSVKFFLAP